MTFSIRATIRGFAAPEHRLSCSRRLWRAGLTELGRRGDSQHESGAFLLGHLHATRRTIERFVYYDDLNPGCLDTGVVVFDGAGYGPLWALCRQTGMSVVADIHTHGASRARQSTLDRDNPMVAKSGHIALIVPDFAQQVVGAQALGVYEYLGGHRWQDHSGRTAARFFYIGMWG